MVDLLEKQNVEEAILLAETIAAVEENKNPVKAEEVIRLLLPPFLSHSLFFVF